MRQAAHLPSLPGSPGRTDPLFSPTTPHKPPVFRRGLTLPGGHRGGHAAAGRLTPSQAGVGPVGAERAAVFWLPPAVPVQGQKGPLEHVGVPLWLGRIQGPRRPWQWSPVGLWGDGEELGAGP